VRVSLRHIFFPVLMIPAAFGLLSGCKEQNAYVPPPPPRVTIAQPLRQPVTEYLEFTGTTQAVEKVEVRARVPGFLERMHFTPGTLVKKGALLFVIDPREYQAILNAALAELDSAKAQLRRAEIELDRADRLFQQKAAPEKDVVKWRGDRDIARAAVAEVNSKVERARLNLGYTQVTSPITGRVGRNLVDLGNLVGEGEATLLTTVTSYDSIYAYFNLNERDLLKVMALYRKKVKEKGLDPDTDPNSEAGIPVFMGLSDEQGYPHEGVVDFAESGVDPGTGTLQLRGIFPNRGKPKELLPGLFVRIRMPIDRREDALLVSDRAVGADQAGRYLLVVNGEDIVEKRMIRSGQLVDGLRVIEEGVGPGAWVIVNGLQRARPGAKVAPERTDMRLLTTSALNRAGEAKKNPSPSSRNGADRQGHPAPPSGKKPPAVDPSGAKPNSEPAPPGSKH